MVVNQLKVHPLSKIWFQIVNLHPYTLEFRLRHQHVSLAAACPIAAAAIPSIQVRALQYMERKLYVSKHMKVLRLDVNEVKGGAG